MISTIQAKEIIAANSGRQRVEDLPLTEATGHVLAAGIVSLADVPAFDNAAMDGYAFPFSGDRAAYRVIGTIEAGRENVCAVHAGEAVRIFTGAPIPEGADTVVPQEAATVSDVFLQVPAAIAPGSNIRKKGSQSLKGTMIVPAERPITPGMVGFIASCGIAMVPVYAAPSVCVITTGNELQEPGCPPGTNRVYNSNAPALLAYLAALGIRKTGYHHLKDHPETIRKAIASALETYDMLILTGGISVGTYDFVQGSLEAEGVRKLFYKVKQKPGKPLFFGVKEDKPVFALPGNPAAVLICFNQYVKPCIRKMMGFTDVFQPSHVLSLQDSYICKEGLTHFVKAKKQGASVRILPGQESFNQLSFNEADCLAELPVGEGLLEAGHPVNIYDW